MNSSELIAFFRSVELLEDLSDDELKLVAELAFVWQYRSGDLRLLSSGPRAGFGEINLPAMQPGSSIMPGKVNPVIPEVVNQIAFKVIGNDLCVTMASEAGQLELNVMEPVIVESLFSSVEMF